jgi:hypothetical protein
MTWTARALAAAVICAGCETAPARIPAQPPPAERTVEQWRGEETAVESEDEEPLEPIPFALPSTEVTPSTAPAAARDLAYDSDAPLAVRRYVYRVRLAIPSALGDAEDLITPGAELYVDTSEERARARFVGQSWPLEAGAEVRLRGDSPGTYVFDGAGGRPLLPSELGEWFEGGERRPGPSLSVRRDPAAAAGERGALVCALLAEWAGEDREAVLRRCDGRAPIAFRVGLWRAERTADLPIEIPRRSLRADEIDPPSTIPPSTSRAFYEPGTLARIEGAAVRGEEIEAADPEAPGEGLLFVNESPTRVVVTAQGVPIGWVAPRSSGLFVGLRPGPIWVGAIRPLGSIALRPRLVSVPARTVLRAVPRGAQTRPSRGEGLVPREATLVP